MRREWLYCTCRNQETLVCVCIYIYGYVITHQSYSIYTLKKIYTHNQIEHYFFWGSDTGRFSMHMSECWSLYCCSNNACKRDISKPAKFHQRNFYWQEDECGNVPSLKLTVRTWKWAFGRPKRTVVSQFSFFAWMILLMASQPTPNVPPPPKTPLLMAY